MKRCWRPGRFLPEWSSTLDSRRNVDSWRRTAPAVPTLSQHRDGFTLIELLLVMAIMSLLISLLIPAIQSSREAARSTQCQSNLRQYGIAMQSHLAGTGRLPAGIAVRVQGPLLTTPKVVVHNYMAEILEHFERSTSTRSFDLHQDVGADANSEVVAMTLPFAVCPSSPFREAPVQAEYSLTEDVYALKNTNPKMAEIVAVLDREYHCRFQGGLSDYTVLSAVNTRTAKEAGYSVPVGMPEQRHLLFGAFPFPTWKPDVLKARIASLLFTKQTIEFAERLSAADIRDGLATTLLMAEDAGRPVRWVRHKIDLDAGPVRGAAWADPASAIVVQGSDDFRSVINSSNRSEIYSFHPSGAHVVFGDGHVETLSPHIDSRALLSLVTPDQGDR